MNRVLSLASILVLAAPLGFARAEPADCGTAASLLKSAYAAPNASAMGPMMNDAKTASDACLNTLTAKLDDCRSRFPDREDECKPELARREACTKLIGAYGQAIQKRFVAQDVGKAAKEKAATEDRLKDFDRGKSLEVQCLDRSVPQG